MTVSFSAALFETAKQAKTATAPEREELDGPRAVKKKKKTCAAYYKSDACPVSFLISQMLYFQTENSVTTNSTGEK